MMGTWKLFIVFVVVSVQGGLGAAPARGNERATAGCQTCQLYGDIHPVGGNCLVDLDDVLCVLDGFAETTYCPQANIYPCVGGGVIDLDDILAVLDAFAADYRCPHPCLYCLEGTLCPLPCDVPVPGAIDHVLDIDLLQFNFAVADGEIVHVRVYPQMPVAPGFATYWRLLDRDANTVCDSGFFEVAEADCAVNMAGNPYRMEVSERQRDNTGPYYVYVQRLTSPGSCEAIPLNCDTPTSGSIDDPIESDLFQFNFAVADGEIVHVSVQPQMPVAPGFATYWRVLNGAGQSVCEPGSFESDCPPVDAGGNPPWSPPYRIEVSEWERDNTGPYYVYVQRLTSPGSCEAIPLNCDTPTSGSIDDPIESDLFQFNFAVADGEIVHVSVQPQMPVAPGFATYWRVLNGAGQSVCEPGSFESDCPPVDAGGNPPWSPPYRIEVSEWERDNTGVYDVYAIVLQGCP